MGPVVLDTNVILLYLGGKIPNLPPASLLSISVVTEMELLSFPDLKPAEESAIRGFCGEIRSIGLEDEIKEAAIEVRRRTRLKLPDAIVAATALVHNSALHSFDKDFKRVQELHVVEPTLK